MNVSIIIVNYNTLEVTAQCLDSIFRLTHGVTFEVILVDNASTDGSREFFARDKRIKYIYNTTNLGFGKANNLGFENAAGEYIFLLNSDTVLLNNAVGLFYEAIRKLPEKVACIGARLLSAELQPNHSYGCFPTLRNTCVTIGRVYKNMLGFKTASPELEQSPQTEPFEVPYITGADLFIKRSVVECCGLFDPDFFMYFEETEMQYRYHRAGYAMYIVPEPQIIHLESGSTKKAKRNNFKSKQLFFNGFFTYLKKRYSWPVYFLFRLVLLAYLPLCFNKKYTMKESLGLAAQLLGRSERYGKNQ